MRYASTMFATRLFYSLFFANLIGVFTLVTGSAMQDAISQLQSQMQTLISQRQDDGNRLESIVRDSLEKDLEIQQLQNEIRNLRAEADSMRNRAEVAYTKGNGAKNERLTVKWLANSIVEIRAEIAEMIRSLNSTTELQQRQTFSTDISMLQNDIVSLRHDVESLKGDMTKYNAKLSVLVQDVEVLKQLDSATANKLTNFTEQINSFSNDWTRFVRKFRKRERRVFKRMIVANESPLEMRVLTLPREINVGRKKRKRHYRLLEDESNSYKTIRSDLIKEKHIVSVSPSPTTSGSGNVGLGNENVKCIETGATDECRNISSEINSIILNLGKRISRLEAFSSQVNFRFKEQEKLHSSMLELLESVENIEAKFDSVTPDLKKEISKLEFTFSQITSNSTVLLEKQESYGRMIKSMMENMSTTRIKLDSYEYNMTLMNSNVNEILSKCDAYFFTHDVLPVFNKNVSRNAEENAINKMLQELPSSNYQHEAFWHQLPKDCRDVDGFSGIYWISPDGGTPILVFCEISDQADSFAYTVIQRRINGTVDFNRSWEEYAKGFGNLLGEFWLGNEIIHRLTKNEDMMARIEFQDSNGKLWYAQYNQFTVASHQDKFRLTLAEFSGNTTNALEYQNHMEFSTRDSDHDISSANCAANYEGGWWFSHCQHTNMNGKYDVGVTWFNSATNEWIDVSSSKIMLAKRKR